MNGMERLLERAAEDLIHSTYAIALTGAGISTMLQGRDEVVLCLHGDGAANNGIWHESLNMACMQQFQTDGVPVIYLIENNLYGMTGQGNGEVTGIELKKSLLMLPRKSISGVIGIGLPCHGIEEYNPCVTCRKKDCPGRRR